MLGPAVTPVGEIWTIGHWACPREVVFDALAVADIEVVVDVRAHPGSRRSPQFGSAELPVWLAEAGIGYRHLPALGGRRPRAEGVDPAINAGWRNESFHRYADYTRTPEFASGLADLTELAHEQRVAILCGEPMPWRCHRLLVANVLAARDWRVWHLVAGQQPREHVLGAWGATPVGDESGTLTYPAPP